MAFSNTHMFRAKLGSKDISNILSGLNYEVSSYEQRMEIVKNLLGEDFFTEYFSGYFKVNIGTKDASATDNNICKALEKITDYLLSSDEVVRDFKEKKTQYKFFSTEERLQEALNKELSIEQISSTVNDKAGDEDIEEDDILYMVMKKTNALKEKKISVTRQDIERDDMAGSILREYDTLKTTLTYLKNNPEARQKIEGNFTRGKISHMIKIVNADMLITKRLLNHRTPLIPKCLGDEGQVIDWDCMDYTNMEHIKALLYSNATVISAENELSFLVHDLENMIRKLVRRNKLKERDLIIIKMIREGYNQDEIAQALSITQVRVCQKISHIAKTISLAFKKEEELYELY